MGQIEIRLTDENCGTCEFFYYWECILTRRKRWKVTPETYACDEHSEDESQKPLETLTLRELGFRPDPSVGLSLQLLGFRDSNLKIGDGNG